MIPAYNGAAFIREAIESCRSQSTSDFNVEIIVVDDGSSDDTVEIVSREFPAVRLLRHTKNQGRHVARNDGRDAAVGEYVKFLDQDDTLDPGTLRAEYRLAVEKGVDMVIAGHRVTRIERGQETVMFTIPQPPDMEPRIRAVLEGVAVPTAAVLYRRSFIADLDWDGSVPRLDDWDYFVRAALKMGTIVGVPHVAYSWRLNPRQYSDGVPLHQFAIDNHRVLGKIEDWLRKHDEFTIENRKALAQYYYKMMRALYKSDRADYHAKLAHIFELDPNFVPVRAAGRTVKWFCRCLGVKAGLWCYNLLADVCGPIKAWRK